MTQKVTEINVEDAAVFIDHNIIRITVPNTEYKSGDTIAGT